MFVRVLFNFERAALFFIYIFFSILFFDQIFLEKFVSNFLTIKNKNHFLGVAVNKWAASTASLEGLQAEKVLESSRLVCMHGFGPQGPNLCILRTNFGVAA